MSEALPDVVRGGEASSGARTPVPAAPLAAETFGREVVSVFGLPFDVVDVQQAVERIRSAAFAHRRCFVSTPNVNFAVAALEDAAFRSSVCRSDLVLADGAPIVRLAQWQGTPLPGRVAGATVFDALRAHSGRPLNLFLFGGAPGVAERARDALDASGGGLRCVGVDQGGMGDVHELGDPGTLDRINASGAHLLAVSLGAKKGQAWIEAQLARLQVPVVCHLGAVFAFAAGAVARAPAPVQRLGLEWLWRVKEEPQLWRRYGRDGVAAARWVAEDALRRVSMRPRGTEPDRVSGPTIETTPDGLRLAGVWTAGDRPALRDALVARSASTAKDTVIDLSAVERLDPQVVGLLQLASGHPRPGAFRPVGGARHLASFA